MSETQETIERPEDLHQDLALATAQLVAMLAAQARYAPDKKGQTEARREALSAPISPDDLMARPSRYGPEEYAPRREWILGRLNEVYLPGEWLFVPLVAFYPDFTESQRVYVRTVEATTGRQSRQGHYEQAPLPQFACAGVLALPGIGVFVGTGYGDTPQAADTRALWRAAMLAGVGGDVIAIIREKAAGKIAERLGISPDITAWEPLSMEAWAELGAALQQGGKVPWPEEEVAAAMACKVPYEKNASYGTPVEELFGTEQHGLLDWTLGRADTPDFTHRWFIAVVQRAYAAHLAGEAARNPFNDPAVAEAFAQTEFPDLSDMEDEDREEESPW